MLDYQKILTPFYNDKRFQEILTLGLLTSKNSAQTVQASFFNNSREKYGLNALKDLVESQFELQNISQITQIAITQQVVAQYVQETGTTLSALLSDLSKAMQHQFSFHMPPDNQARYVQQLMGFFTVAFTIIEPYVQNVAKQAAIESQTKRDDGSTFNAVFQMSSEQLEQLFQMSADLQESIALICASPTDFLFCPAFLTQINCSPASGLAGYLGALAELAALQEKVCGALPNLQALLNLSQRLLSSKNLLKYFVDFDTLEQFSRLWVVVAPPAQFVSLFLTRDSIQKLLETEDPARVVQFFCRLSYGLRNAKTSSKNSLSLSNSSQSPITPVPLQSARLSLAGGSGLRHQLLNNTQAQQSTFSASKLIQNLSDGIELLGPRFLRVSAAVIAELSCEAGFWDPETPDALLVLQKWLGIFMDAGQQQILKAPDVRICEDLVNFLINAHGQGNSALEQLQGMQAVKLLLQPKLSQNAAQFLLHVVFEAVLTKSEAIIHHLCPELLELFGQKILQSQVLAILISALQCATELAEHDRVQLSAFFGVAFKTTKMSDALVRDVLQLTQHLLERGIADGFLSHSIPAHLVDLLKQRPNDTQAQIISIVFLVREDAAVMKSFQQLGIANVLKRLIVKESLKEKFAAITQALK